MVLYSHSRLSAFENCPLKYKFRYIDKLRTDVSQSIEAFMGDMVHQTLEKVYTDAKFQKFMTAKEAKEYLKQLWKKNWNDSIVIVRKEYGPSNYLKMALKFIEDYFKKYDVANDGITIGLEERVVINLDKQGRFKLQGYIDRLACHNDTEYHIIDYKTNSHLKIQDQLDNDRQLALYQLAVQHNYRDAKKILLKWRFLAFNKELTSIRTREELKALKKDTIQLIKQIEKTKEFKPKVSRLCDWCEYRQICPEWAHMYELETKSANEYLKDDGVTLVNKYIELSEQKRKLVSEIDEKLDKLKEALVKFAKKRGVNVVFGSNNKIRVSITDHYKFPGKGTKEREKLIEVLKKLRKWEEIADIDTYGLNRIMKEKLWSPQELRLIRRFATKEETHRLYPSRINKEEDTQK